MVVIMQAAGVDEMRTRAAELLCALVHHVYKRVVTAGDVPCQHVSSFVGRGQHERIEQILDRNGLALFDAGVRTVRLQRFKV